ncbi:hypothetical protein [Halobacteriovorax sp.]|uniref:hypothetical protein n=1 Tax=Halobacteriovorax sp. TaxID=2020862 RepID=UPI003AF1F532
MNNIENEIKLAKIVGFDLNKVSEIESQLNNGHSQDQDNLYLQGLKEEAINTSLLDFYEILKEVQSRSNGEEVTICDIGASYCKMAFVAQAFFPKITIVSIEPVKERIDYAINILDSSKHIFFNDYFRKTHVEKYRPDYIFLYFPVCDALEEILEIIDSPIIAIEAHGQLINRLGHAYKHKEVFTKLIMPRHNPMSYFFSKRRDSEAIVSLNRISSSADDLMIINDRKPWFADKEGLRAYFDEEEKITIELQNPPRTIYFSDNLETIKSSELDTNVQQIISMRREGKQIDGCYIRKIFVDGSFEVSSGEIKKAP